MEEDFNVYDDLDIFVDKSQEPSEEISELNKALRNVTEKLTEANKKYEHLQNLNKTLKYNISTVLLTARRELSRKDERINSLVKEKDAIIFRRAGPKSKPKNELKDKTGFCNSEITTNNHKQTCNKYVQTQDKNDETIRVDPNQKRNKCIQTDKLEKPRIKMYNQSSQTDLPNNHFQIVKYVGELNTVYRTEYVQVQELIEKRHQSIQTVKNNESLVLKERVKNSKTTVDDSDAIESLLALSQGCSNVTTSQNLQNDDYEKLLLDRQSILDELNKEDDIPKAVPVRKPGRPPKKHDKKKPSLSKLKLNSHLDIYELSPIHQMDKSKPIRQYGGGRGKQNSKLLQVLLQDCKKPIGVEVDDQNIEKTKIYDTEIKPTLPQVAKKLETEIVKHSRKQKFTNIRTNCNLEHIPTEPFEFQRKKTNVVKSKPKITRSRKRRLDALFEEAVEEAVTKQSLRSETLAIVANVEKISKLPVTKTEIITESKSEVPTSSSKSDNQTILVCSNSKLKTTPSLDLPRESSINNDNPIEPMLADSQSPPTPPLSSVENPLLPPNNNNDNKIKRVCLDPEPQATQPVELSLPLNIVNDSSETLTSQDSGEQNGQNNTLNSSVEIKMSTTSYKIETHGDETTVYIRRNKKKKKHVA